MRIGLDFDGVIADCGKLKREGAQRLFNIDIPEEKFKKEIVIREKLLNDEQYRILQKEIYGNPEVGLCAELVPNTHKYIEKLLKEGHELSIITSRAGASLEVAKQWLNYQKILLPIIGVGQGKTKEEACKKLQIEIFVDDDIDKLEEITSCVPNLFLFSWGYNEKDNEKPVAKRVYSWEHLYETITGLLN